MQVMHILLKLQCALYNRKLSDIAEINARYDNFYARVSACVTRFGMRVDNLFKGYQHSYIQLNSIVDKIG